MQPLSRVDPLVAHKVVLPVEASPTHQAGIGPLPAVDALVPLQVRLLDKTVATHIAAEWALARVNLLVAAQVLSAVEAFPAVGTGEGPLARHAAVASLMCLQVGLRHKAAAALITGEGLFFGRTAAILMGPLVSEEVRTAGEAFPALGAAVGPLRRVNQFLVPQQSLPVSKPLLALVTGERGLARVSAPVGHQVLFPAKALTALGTIKGPFSRVDAAVRDQVRLAVEAFAAQVA